MEGMELSKIKVLEYLSTHRGSVDQKELKALQITDLSSVLRELLEQSQIKVSSTGDSVRVDLCAKAMSSNFALVLEEVGQCGTSGVDQATLATKLRMPKTEVAKALHSLVAQRFVQERRSFTNRAKKVYLLSSLEPSDVVTGGTLYCGEELDTNFVDGVRCLLVSYIYEEKIVTLTRIQEWIRSVMSGRSAAQNSDNAVARYCASPVSVVSDFSVRSPIPPSSAQRVMTAAASLPTKQISDEDVKRIVNSLVLDGVADTFTSQEGIPLYRLAVGKNVMRHFTVMKRPASMMLKEEANVKEEGTGRGGSRPTLDRQGEQMVPAPISEVSAGASPHDLRDIECDEWNYMPAMGFPCLSCPSLSACEEKGVVNPFKCPYIREWLQ